MNFEITSGYVFSWKLENMMSNCKYNSYNQWGTDQEYNQIPKIYHLAVFELHKIVEIPTNII